VSSEWSFRFAEKTFLQVLEERGRSLLQQLQGAADNISDTEMAVGAWEAFDAFKERILKHSGNKTDPGAELEPALESGQPMPGCFYFKVGGWRAYYHLDESELVCSGIYICHDDDDQEEALSIVLEDARKTMSPDKPRGAG